MHTHTPIYSNETGIETKKIDRSIFKFIRKGFFWIFYRTSSNTFPSLYMISWHVVVIPLPGCDFPKGKKGAVISFKHWHLAQGPPLSEWLIKILVFNCTLTELYTKIYRQIHTCISGERSRVKFRNYFAFYVARPKPNPKDPLVTNDFNIFFFFKFSSCHLTICNEKNRLKSGLGQYVKEKGRVSMPCEKK